MSSNVETFSAQQQRFQRAAVLLHRRNERSHEFDYAVSRSEQLSHAIAVAVQNGARLDVPSGGFLQFVAKQRGRSVRLLSAREQAALAAYYGAAERQWAVRKAQAAVRGWRERRRYDGRRNKSRQRVKVLAEILQTERVFRESLAVTVRLFLGPIRAAIGSPKECLTEAEVQRVFGNLEQVLGFSRELYAALEERLRAIDADTCVGDVFLQFVPYMKVFNAYCIGYELCAAFLKESAKQPHSPFNNLCNEASSSGAAGGLNLNSYLIMPVQRLPRYRLLLKDLLDKTWPGHPDYVQLTAALDAVAKAAQDVNAFVKANDGAAKVVWMEKNVKGVHDIVTPTRVFLKEGVCTVRATDQSAAKLRVFLLNDLVLVTSNEKQPSLKYRVDLNHAAVRDVDDMQSIRNSFRLIGVEQSLLFTGANAGEKTFWMNDFQAAIDELHGQAESVEAASVAVGGDSSRLSPRRGPDATPLSPRRRGAGVSVRVVGTETRVAAKEYTVYIVQVIDANSQRDYKIFRRFSDFDDLHAKLKKTHSHVPPLPKKKMFGSMSAKVMENRKIGLDSFLHQLVARNNLVNNDVALRAFLELDQVADTHEAVVVTLFLLDGSKKTFRVKSNIRSAALSQMMAGKLRVEPHDAVTFGIFLVSDDLRRALQPDDHPVAVRDGWGGGARLVYAKANFRRGDVEGTPASLRSAAHRQLMYIQAVHDVVNCVWPTKDELALKLAGLQCARQFGTAEHTSGFSLVGLIDQYIPQRMRKKRSPAQWESDILQQHRTLTADELADPELAYLNYVRHLPFFGAQFFNNVEPLGVKEFGSLVKLAVRHDGMMVVGEKFSLQAFFDFTMQLKITSTPKTINVETPVREFRFKTREGFAIETLVKQTIEQARNNV